MRINKRELARQLRTKFPHTSDHSLAQLLYENNKLLFKDKEYARWIVRKIGGKAGSEKHSGEIIPKLPRSYAKPPSLYKLPVADNNILLISDLHIPYHDNEAINAALEFGIKEKVNTIFINGDLLDFHHQSKFEHDPRKRSTKEEFDATIEFLEYLRSKFPTQNIYFLLGNHDKRYENWLMQKAPMLFMDDYYLLEDRLNLARFSIKKLDDFTLVKAGKLCITHGHLLLKGVFAPVNAARGVFMRGKESCLIGHAHKVSEHQETTLQGKVIITYSTGCLCALNQDYAPFANNYMHGFAHIKTENNGDFHVRNYKIIKGKIY